MAKRILKKFRITEVSTVDDPAQKGANSVIMKRADDGDDIMKGGKMLTVTKGHQHILITDHGDGEMQSGMTRWAKAPGSDHDHSHPWVRNPDGTITIGMADGHTHYEETVIVKGAKAMDKQQLIDAITKYIGGDTSQADDIKKAAKTLDMENMLPAALSAPAPTVDVAKAESLALMTDVQKAHYKSLDEAGQADFLKMTDDVRDAEIAKANKPDDDDTIIYKADDGTVFTKRDGQKLADMAKRNDQMAKDNAELKKKADDADIAKRAAELIPNLGGDDAGRVAMLKSVESIEDETVRKSAMDSLKSANDAAADAFTRKGTSDIGKSASALTAEDELENMAQDIMKRDSVTHAQAYTTALQSEAGQKLYAQSVRN